MKMSPRVPRSKLLGIVLRGRLAGKHLLKLDSVVLNERRLMPNPTGKNQYSGGSGGKKKAAGKAMPKSTTSYRTAGLSAAVQKNNDWAYRMGVSKPKGGK